MSGTKKEIKSIAVLTSGGDSPGMNCAIRAVVRTAISKDLDVYGIKRGYSGLLEGAVEKMDASSVGNIMQRGGTMLQTSRCKEFHEAETRKEAANILRRKGIDALIVIGGNGSYQGAALLHEEHGIPVIGIPGTIDNDISGTDYTVGFDTAVQTAVEAVDKIRDTAHSHARTFIVEVMGRKSPAIALHVGVCTGAENVVFPSKEVDYDEIISDIKRGAKRGKNSSIVVVAEGEVPGLAYKIQENLYQKHKLKSHVCILGHIQRGGRPSPIDRFLSSRMGYEAVQGLVDGNYPSATIYKQGEVELAPLKECLGKKTEHMPQAYQLVKTLSI
ncbi:MAG: 6-phosphofructokinase [Halobacteriovorax sp.]|nr:6-phosphofructokinase [Halobacteriovorax sp.]|tara:strand:+ start:6482 stop:7471 length:990 start_codon:yes stop_codon:yes gene_type:complete